MAATRPGDLPNLQHYFIHIIISSKYRIFWSRVSKVFFFNLYSLEIHFIFFFKDRQIEAIF